MGRRIVLKGKEIPASAVMTSNKVMRFMLSQE
jgi:hypothetical protein